MSSPTYPLTMPTNVGFTDSEFRLNRAVSMTQSAFTGAQKVYEYDYALWSGVFTLPPMNRAQASQWLAFLMKLHGKKGTFLLGDPDAKTPRGGITGAVSVSGAHSIGDYTIELQTAQNSTSDLFKAGDYIQFGSGATSKLHMIVEDSAQSSASGTVTVTIEPALKAALSDGSAVIYTNTKAVMRMSSNELGWSADKVSKYGISFSCTEVV